MSAPFRQDALALAATDAAPVLAKWDAEALPLDLRIALLFIGRPYAPVRAGEAPSTKLTGEAAGLGFEFLGHFRFAGLIPFFGPVREAWTDRDRLVRVSFRRAVAHGPIEATMGAYILTTMFDDGTAITTWSHDVQLPRNERVTHRVGTGILAVDYEAHRAAVLEHTSETSRPLRVADLATALAMSTHYDRRVTPWAIVTLAQARGVVFFVLALAATLVASRIRW